MESVSVNKFRENLREFVDKVSINHDPLKVTRRNGNDFVVLSAEDWGRDRHLILEDAKFGTRRLVDWFRSLNEGLDPDPTLNQ